MVSLYELPLGGTAVGTGINTHPLFAKKAISILNERTGNGSMRRLTILKLRERRMLWWR